MNKVLKILSVLLGIGLLNLAMINAYATFYLAITPSVPLLLAQATTITPIVLAAFGMFLIFRDGIIPLVFDSKKPMER